MATAPEFVERRSARLDFTTLVEERTQDFTGREWVFEAIGRWRSRATGAAAPGVAASGGAADSDAAADNKSRMFLLTGGPGTGKTAIAARLVQMHHGKVATSGEPAVASGELTYYHFCQAGLDSTLSPTTFVQSLAEALANRFPTYHRLLTQTGSQQFVVKAEAHANTVAAGATVIGAQVRIEILSGDARPLFDLMVRRPLQTLCQVEPDVSILILVDSLDEALSFNPESNIAQLLRLVNDFPAQVRFIATCRSNNALIFDLVGPPTLDLIADAPKGSDEVGPYVRTRLREVPEPERSEVAQRIAAHSSGNFLYAFHVLNALLRPGVKSLRGDALDLPDTLEDVYRQFLRRQLAANPTRWADIYRPILGLIAVARGDGLGKGRLIEITGLAEDVAKDVLDTCAEYLVGDEKGETYRIYHQSFRDFLLTDPKFTVAPAERHAALARYLEDQYAASWGSCTDVYALRYTAPHWADAAELSEVKRESRTQSLITLLQNSRYQRAFERRVGEMTLLKDYLHRAVQIAVLNPRVEMLPWIIKASLGLVAFNRDYLQAESLMKLAEEGELEDAEARLKLFGDLDVRWKHVARVILTWLAIERSPMDPGKVESLLRQADLYGGTLGLLLERVAAAAAGDSVYPCNAVPEASLPLAQAVVRRISGQGFDRELLFSEVNPSLLVPGTTSGTERGYAAQEDAPILVSFALSSEREGTALFDQYLDAHAGYNYVEYRNTSLWFVLEAVLRLHPSQSWVRDRLRRILAAALTGGAPDYRELLAFTAEVLQERVYAKDSRNALDGLRGIAMSGANGLENKVGANDAYAFHKRRLSGVMELFSLCAQDRVAADEVFGQIWGLPGGFAGFQAPAYLRVADGLRACGLEGEGRSGGMLGAAVGVAHNIQDYHFCARVTARCQALRRWHSTSLEGEGLCEAVQRLAQEAASSEFAADHFVGEAYRSREGGDEALSIALARDAVTLEELEEVFQRPIVEFRRLNPQYLLGDRIAEGTLIKVPDPGLAPLLAVHLAARVLADDTLEDERVGLIRELVPVAAANPTALDTVLSWLLIASQVEDVGLIGRIVGEVGPVTFGDVPVPLAQIGPHAVIPS